MADAGGESWWRAQRLHGAMKWRLNSPGLPGVWASEALAHWWGVGLVADPLYDAQFHQSFQRVRASKVLNDLAIAEALDIDPEEADRFMRGSHACPIARVCSAHGPPGDDGILLSNLAVHCDRHIRVTPAEGQQVLSKPIQRLSFCIGYLAIAGDKLRQSIDGTSVAYILEEAAREGFVLCIGHE